MQERDLENGVTDLIQMFNGLFAESLNTRLVAGDGDPIYLPADASCDYHRVVFAHGYFASVMHEVAHWCVAGPERRKLEDFGYWYRPDGRTAEQQAEFEQVEVKPQAMEWHFTQACGRKFHASADNLSGEARDDTAFRHAVSKQARYYARHGLPERAQAWTDALQAHFGGELGVEKFYWPDEHKLLLKEGP